MTDTGSPESTKTDSAWVTDGATASGGGAVRTVVGIDGVGIDGLDESAEEDGWLPQALSPSSPRATVAVAARIIRTIAPGTYPVNARSSATNHPTTSIDARYRVTAALKAKPYGRPADWR